MKVTLLTARTTTNSAPSAATDGVQVRKTGTSTTERGLGGSQRAMCLVHSTAGSGTMAATIKLWGYNDILAKWFVIGTLNGAASIAESTTDLIRHAEVVENLLPWLRVYAEVTAITGTATAVTVDLLSLPGVTS